MRKTRAGSIPATRRKLKRAAPRHITTVPRKTAAEKPGESVLASVPHALPALLRAQKISRKAAATGFDCMSHALESITAGEIRIGDRVVNDVAPRERDIAMVFQDYALYPQMSVFDNLAFGLRRRKTPKDEITQRVEMRCR